MASKKDLLATLTLFEARWHYDTLPKSGLAGSFQHYQWDWTEPSNVKRGGLDV
jgi:hypothetical protein